MVNPFLQVYIHLKTPSHTKNKLDKSSFCFKMENRILLFLSLSFVLVFYFPCLTTRLACRALSLNLEVRGGVGALQCISRCLQICRDRYHAMPVFCMRFMNIELFFPSNSRPLLSWEKKGKRRKKTERNKQRKKNLKKKEKKRRYPSLTCSYHDGRNNSETIDSSETIDPRHSLSIHSLLMINEERALHHSEVFFSSSPSTSLSSLFCYSINT